ncbi:MAG TPA: hypothetical protein VGV57_08475 [Thermoleophilaceae bacterium]|nr:hypothetical protein [Thermoleophilaceae bacterium]
MRLADCLGVKSRSPALPTVLLLSQAGGLVIAGVAVVLAGSRWRAVVGRCVGGPPGVSTRRVCGPALGFALESTQGSCA